MKKLFELFSLSLVLISFTVINTSCNKEEPITPKPKGEIPVVSQFVYDGMSLYYLWAEDMINKKPTINDVVVLSLGRRYD